jgi:hypothetical protein
MQGKKKTETELSDKRVNVAMTKHDSIFPNIHLPGGISSKATEYKELAMRGEKWESPIFKLGSASTTTDIAHAPQVTRKDHPVTQGGVRDRQNAGGTSPSAGGTAAMSNGTAVNGPTTGFNNEVDQAFNEPSARITNGAPSRGTNAANVGTNGKTLLGSHNPVLTGDV